MISIPVLVVGFVIGLVLSMLSRPSKRVLYVHPNPDNHQDYVFRDMSGTCFSLEQMKVDCTDRAIDYPVQT